MCVIDSVEFVARFPLLTKLITCHETGAWRSLLRDGLEREREVKERERETVICGQEREWRRREMADQKDGHWDASELKIGKKICLTMGGNCLRNVLFIRLMVAHT